ncbi:hypothetical protein GCM10009613_65850 [Pseudonocardia kongjuensis]|uniref:Uncharacterized protein n=1 Tax=Pseudonocardia kongjuensis TaxID=102227 RepID=A0ABP4J2B1_9PSEU
MPVKADMVTDMTEGRETRAVRDRLVREYGSRLTVRAARMAARAPGRGESPASLRALARNWIDETSTCLRLAADLLEARMADDEERRAGG